MTRSAPLLSVSSSTLATASPALGSTVTSTPIFSAAGDDHGFGRIGAAVCLDCIVPAGERLDQRAGLEAHSLGQLVQPFGAGLEQLRIGAIDAETEMIDLLAT